MFAYIVNQSSNVGKTRLSLSIRTSSKNLGSASSFRTTSRTIISKNNKCQTYRYRISPTISNFRFQHNVNESKVSHQYRNNHGTGVAGELHDDDIQKNQEAKKAEESLTLLEKFQTHQRDEYLTVSILGPSNAGEKVLCVPLFDTAINFHLYY